MSRSSRLMEQAQAVIPGGVNSPVRAFKAVGGSPPFIARARDHRIVDADGRVFVDLVSSWGAVIAGHAHPAIVRAAQEAAARGSSFGAPTEGEVRLAEEIVARVPSIDAVRVCNSGTEATMHAVRLARAATGRDLLVKMDGCYHGAHDACLVGAGSGLATLGIPGSPGVPEAVAALTRVVPFNDLDAVEDLLRREGDQVAAILVEPVAGNMGCIPPLPGYLEGLRALCDAHGVVLIFDEVMTGFRLARGGAQERFGVLPDLTCLGKVVGGGFPMAAFGGRADLMDRLAPRGDVYQAGTLSGNPVAVAAGHAALQLLDEVAYARLEAIGERIEDALAEVVRYHGCSFARVGSMFTLFFRERAPVNFAEAKTCDTDAFARYFHAALSSGIYLPCSQFEAAFFAYTLDEGEDLARVTAGLEQAVVLAAG
jgi:glutamate-1-semialdehyde 2,1-aminomutase